MHIFFEKSRAPSPKTELTLYSGGSHFKSESGCIATPPPNHSLIRFPEPPIRFSQTFFKNFFFLGAPFFLDSFEGEFQMAFRSHLEYINHITCNRCNHYWTYSSMDPKFQISRGEYYCPSCGVQGAVQEEDYRTSIDNSETSTNWFPSLPKVKKSVAPQLDLCLCADSPKGKICDCGDLWFAINLHRICNPLHMISKS